jgi:hypothetical protein
MQYSHPTLLTGLYFTVLQIGKIGPRIKIHHSDPSMDRNIKIFQQIQWVFKPYHMVFQGVSRWGEQFPSQCFNKEKTQKNTKVLFFFFGGGGYLFADFHLSMEVLKTNPCEK